MKDNDKSKQKRFFHGWVIVGAAILAGISESAVWNPTVSVFVKPMSEELGWTRAMLSGAITIGSICGGLLGSVLGPVIDKRGARLVLVSGIAGLGASLIALSQTYSIAYFYFFFGIGRAITSGATSLAITVAISNWFIGKRGRAMAITALGERVGTAFLPLFVQYLVLTQGWRTAWLSLGFLAWVLAIVPCALFMKRRPEDMGLKPDGRHAQPKLEPRGAPLEPAWTAREAMKTQTFWLLALASMQANVVMGGVNLHQLPYMTDIGISPTAAVGALSITALAGGVGSFFWGLLTERISVRYCLLAALLASAASLVLLMSIRTVAMTYAYATLYGLSLGGKGVLISIIWPYHFGRFSLGTIRGFTWPLLMGANSLGPLLAGWIFDTTGSYRRAFELFTAISILAAMCILLTKVPQHPTTFGKTTKH